MHTIQNVIDYLESIAPRGLQESYDNAGLIVGNSDWQVSGVLCTLDSTEEIVEEARDRGCNLIVAHHPIIFKGLKQLQGKHYVDRTIIKAIKHDIAIYAIHTNLDNVYRNGVNSKIASQLSLQHTSILAPKSTDNLEIGSGMIGRLPQPMTAEDFLIYLKDNMHLSCIRYTQWVKPMVETVALCGGAGSFLIRHAIQHQADVFVTADVKYHEFFESNNAIWIADIGHYESEQFTPQLLLDLISKKFTNFAAYCTEHVTNPVKYFT